MAVLEMADGPAANVIGPDDMVASDAVQRWFRNPRPVVIGALIGLVLGIAVLISTPSSYISTVGIWVRDAPRDIDPVFSANQRILSIDTEAQRVLADATLSQAGITLGPDGTATDIEITAPVNARILRVRVTADSAESAQQQARALGSAFLTVRRDFLTERRESSLSALRNEIDAIGASAVTAPTESARAAWNATLDEAFQKLSSLNATTVSPGAIVSKASAGEPLPRSILVWPVSGLVLGAMVGLAFRELERGRNGEAPSE